MARVSVTVNGVTVECDLEDVKAVTAALGGGKVEDTVLRGGERRRENPEAATQTARAEEFRKIRSKYTDKSVEQVAAAALPRDGRRRSPYAGDR